MVFIIMPHLNQISLWTPECLSTLKFSDAVSKTTVISFDSKNLTEK